jgi:hypothetical protein
MPRIREGRALMGTPTKQLAMLSWFEAREPTRRTNVPFSQKAHCAPWYVRLGLENGT